MGETSGHRLSKVHGLRSMQLFKGWEHLGEGIQRRAMFSAYEGELEEAESRHWAEGEETRSQRAL